MKIQLGNQFFIKIYTDEDFFHCRDCGFCYDRSLHCWKMFNCSPKHKYIVSTNAYDIFKL